jgi:hypothetical protein
MDELTKLATLDSYDLVIKPRQHLLELCKKDLNVPYKFAAQSGKGANVVQAMRVTLSRLRKQAADKQVHIPAFKIVQDNIESNIKLFEDGPLVDVVTLRRTEPGAQLKASAALDEVLITLGVTLNG